MGKVAADYLKGDYPTELKACHVDPVRVMDRHAKSESSMRWYGSSRIHYLAGQLIENAKHADFPMCWQRLRELSKFIDYYPQYQAQVDEPLTMEVADRMLRANIFGCTNKVIQNKMLMDYIKLMGKAMIRDEAGSNIDHDSLAAELDKPV